MDNNRTLKELSEITIIGSAIKEIKRVYYPKFKGVTFNIDVSAQFNGGYVVTYKRTGKEEQHIEVLFMKDSLQMILDGMNKALEKLK